MKRMFHGDTDTREKKTKEIKRAIAVQDNRINQLKDMLVDGKISTGDYSSMKSRDERAKEKLLEQMRQMKSVKSNWHEWLSSGIHMLSKLQDHYNSTDVPGKQRLISSIFPENLQFDGKKCRTPRINEALRQILLIDRGKRGNKKGQHFNNLVLSPRVKLEGLPAVIPPNPCREPKFKWIASTKAHSHWQRMCQ